MNKQTIAQSLDCDLDIFRNDLRNASELVVLRIIREVTSAKAYCLRNSVWFGSFAIKLSEPKCSYRR